MIIGMNIGGRYQIQELIGGGGMSNVYLAHDRILDRDVAIKILRYNFSDEDDLHRRFQREASSATSLTHPNIVSIYDVGEEEDMHYLVMEYIKGQTLKQYIQQYAPVSPTRAVSIMLELTSAIAHAHQNQIIHRDIKPQNILMDEEGNVKITDFGIAMALSATSFTKTNSVLGTVHYLSPEQARGGVATVKSDMYALGIVLYELLTGQLPFMGESAVSIALKHLQAETPSVRNVVPAIPQSLENVVLKATAKEPHNRYANVEAMRADLQTVLDENRRNEAKFSVPEDMEKTKALPIIRDFKPEEMDEATIAMIKEEKPNPKPVPPTKKKKKRNKFLVTLFTLAILMVLFLATIILFPNLFKAEQIEMPNVVDISYEKALNQVQNAGLDIGERTMEYSDDVAEGKVIRTTPAVGKKVDKKTAVDFVVSEGKKRVTLDDYIGRDIEQVQKLLTKRGFKVKVEKVFSEKNVGEILDQNPSADLTVIPSETPITFKVSKGEETFEIANLIGYSEEQLKTYADNVGATIRISDDEYSSTVMKGLVSSQTPAARTTVTKNTEIKVIMSKGPKMIPSKTLIRSIEIPYNENNDEDTTTSAAEKINIYIQDKDHAVDDVYETFMISETTTRRLKLIIEENKSGIYRITRDGEEIYNETIRYEDL
ncbi:Stk1 family PASTA domain-containing Ser/Thr kinase [Kurthia senegalensis]|uniref:Stk1 family PASTA domain-containing Ser/Thr kinase n=1 Tax=Kurthia senegalensis TaxID=1033740 RepID=UPI000288339A|nr:Stk1 family PASTA domain-containing Ser/Thr kinase [Kurthia senegalensis]